LFWFLHPGVNTIPRSHGRSHSLGSRSPHDSLRLLSLTLANASTRRPLCCAPWMLSRCKLHGWLMTQI
jgi:hypothetical protein